MSFKAGLFVWERVAFFVVMSLQISHLSKSYQGQYVLKDITFSISDGERVAIVGKNGSGKSTLLKIIAGLEKGDSGTVSIPGGMTTGYIPQVPDDDVSSKLSSGQKTKAYLAKLVRTQPDLLLLDEPTNHLDLEGLEWLENYVTHYHGAILFVSHDRMFLDRIATKILELENGDISVYGGNYSFYRQEKDLRQEAYERQYIAQKKEIKRLTHELHINKQRGQVANKIKKRPGEGRAEAGFFANRQSQIFGSVGKNIKRQIDRMNKLVKPESIPELKTLFKPKRESGESVLLMKDVSKNFGDKMVLQNVQLHIQKGERVAIVGSNGSGKSTLIKLITGELELDWGNLALGTNVDIGYLSQDHSELESDQTVIDELEKNSHLSTTDVYKLLVRFLLPPDTIRQSVNTLSSGEKAKLLLAEIMTAGSNFLILDEPTNHLDIPSREAFEEALANFEGTLLVISHDRYFLESIGVTKRILIENGKLKT